MRLPPVNISPIIGWRCEAEEHPHAVGDGLPQLITRFVTRIRRPCQYSEIPVKPFGDDQLVLALNFSVLAGRMWALETRHLPRESRKERLPIFVLALSEFRSTVGLFLLLVVEVAPPQFPQGQFVVVFDDVPSQIVRGDEEAYLLQEFVHVIASLYVSRAPPPARRKARPDV